MIRRGSLDGWRVWRPLLTLLPVVAVGTHRTHLPTALRRKGDGHFCLLVYTACDSVYFPMPVLMVLTAVVCGAALYAAEPCRFSAKCALLVNGSGEYAGYCLVSFLRRSAAGFQVAGCQVGEDVKLKTPGDGCSHVRGQCGVFKLGEQTACLSNGLRIPD